jgi:aquaporin Z
VFSKLSAEFIGTFWLVLGGCGSAVIAAGFPAVGIGLLGVSLAFGLTVLSGAYALGPISGGHFNPAVSVGLWAGGRFPAALVLPYTVAQVLGGIAGAFIVAALFKNGIAGAQGKDVLFGATTIAHGVEWPQALLAEAFLAFILMTAIMAVAMSG